jgi:maltose O-acetyltransferase
VRNYLSELRLYVCNHLVAALPSHFIRLLFYRHVARFEIGAGAAIHLGAWFEAIDGLTVGSNSVINDNCRLDTRGRITIGRNVSISPEVIILTADHDLESPNFAGRHREVTVGDYAWIGTRAMVLPGVQIGEGAVVGAGAIVTGNVAPYTVVVGAPAHPIRERPRNLAYQLNYRRLFR